MKLWVGVWAILFTTGWGVLGQPPAYGDEASEQIREGNCSSDYTPTDPPPGMPDKLRKVINEASACGPMRDHYDRDHTLSLMLCTIYAESGFNPNCKTGPYHGYWQFEDSANKKAACKELGYPLPNQLQCGAATFCQYAGKCLAKKAHKWFCNDLRDIFGGTINPNFKSCMKARGYLDPYK